MKTKIIPSVKLFLCMGALLVLVGQAWAGAHVIPFQGRLSDANGNAVPDGAKVIQFKIYDAPVGGRAVWNGEVQKLTVNGGLVSTLLGTKADLSNVDFDQDLYLELTIDANDDGQINLADPPLLPRQSILPAVFAKESANSRLLEGYDWSPLFGTNNPADGTLLDSKIRDGSINASKLLPASIHAGLVASNTFTLATLAKEVSDLLCPAGAIMAFGGQPAAIPDGWLLCDGRAVSSTNYPKLFIRIGSAWGNGSDDVNPATDFNLPDLRGQFLRGVDGTASVDPDRASRTAIKVGGNPGNLVGSVQLDALKSHNHTNNLSGTTSSAGSHSHTFPIGDGDAGTRDKAADGDQFSRTVSTDSAGLHSHTFTVSGNTGPFGGLETRPRNAYVHYIIKY
jgi:microcystin-dependent protein